MHRHLPFLATVLFGLWGAPALAQNTGGVFGPVVKENTQFAEYRVSLVPDRDGAAVHAQRVSLESAINGEVKWRLIGQGRDIDSGDFSFDFVQAELTWQVTPDDQNWQSGLRFDARLRDHGRPGQLGVNWTNQFTLSDKWQARAVLMSAIQTGNLARDGLLLQTRTNLSRMSDSGIQTGVEIYNNYGSTDHLGSFKTQTHQAGPFLTMRLNDNWTLFGSALIGLSDRADDLDLRLRIGRGL